VTALQVAQKFVERINAADVAGLAALMTEDHRFIDSLGNVVTGREAMKAGCPSRLQGRRFGAAGADKWV